MEHTVLRFLGISDEPVILCQLPLRLTAGISCIWSTTASAPHRRDSGLVPSHFPPTSTAWLILTVRPVLARRCTAGFPSRPGRRTSSTMAGARMRSFLMSSAMFWWINITSTACAWMRSPRCCISITRASRRMDSQQIRWRENLEAIDFLRRFIRIPTKRSGHSDLRRKSPHHGPWFQSPSTSAALASV